MPYVVLKLVPLPLSNIYIYVYLIGVSIYFIHRKKYIFSRLSGSSTISFYYLSVEMFALRTWLLCSCCIPAQRLVVIVRCEKRFQNSETTNEIWWAIAWIETQNKPECDLRWQNVCFFLWFIDDALSLLRLTGDGQRWKNSSANKSLGISALFVRCATSLRWV